MHLQLMENMNVLVFSVLPLFTRGGFLGIMLVLLVNKALKRPKPRKRMYVSPVRRQSFCGQTSQL